MTGYKSFNKTHPKLRLSRAKVHSALCLKWSHIIHTWETDNVHNWFIHSIQIQHTYLRNIIQTHIWFIIGNMSTMFCNPKYLIFITRHKYLLITGEKKATERRIGQCWRNAVKCKIPSTTQQLDANNSSAATSNVFLDQLIVENWQPKSFTLRLPHTFNICLVQSRPKLNIHPSSSQVPQSHCIPKYVEVGDPDYPSSSTQCWQRLQHGK